MPDPNANEELNSCTLSSVFFSQAWKFRWGPESETTNLGKDYFTEIFINKVGLIELEFGTRSGE